MIWRIIDHPQFQRIHLQRVGEFIHRALECIRARAFTRRAHERRLRNIYGVNDMIELDRGGVVENICRSDSTSLHPMADRRSNHFASMPDGLQFSIFAGRESNCLKSWRPMTGPAEHFLSR